MSDPVKKSSQINQISKESPNILEDHFKKLKLYLPYLFTEGKIDFDKFKLYFGENVDDDADEKYSFNWVGRKETVKNIKSKVNKTLMPRKSESINFDLTENLFIEGDNLEVLKLLQKSYFNKVKMIYIDPPYNTGKSFIYRDNYRISSSEYMEKSGQIDESGAKLTTNPETNGRFHSDWITMMFSRIFVASNLLRDDGVIFVSIGDDEVHHLRLIMNEIFGEENFIAEIVWNSKYTISNDKKFVSNQHEFVLAYANDIEICDFNLLPRTKKMDKRYTNPDDDIRGPWKPTPLHAKSGNSNYVYKFKNDIEWTAPDGRYPRYSQDTLKRLDEENRIWFGKNLKTTPSVKSFLSEVKSGLTTGSLWKYDEVGHTHEANEELAKLVGKGVFDNPKPSRLIKRMILLATEKDNNEIILDFFAGSGTTAHAVMEQNKEDNGNRKFILIQLKEETLPKSIAHKKGYNSIPEICKDRIKKVIETIMEENIEVEIDLGFKDFKLNKSNYKIWEEYNGDNSEELLKQMKLFDNPLMNGYKEIDVVYECIIKEGFDMNSKIIEIKTKTNTLYKVIDDNLIVYICLDDEISNDTLDELKLSKLNLFICLDGALSDSKKKNLALQCILKTI